MKMEFLKRKLKAVPKEKIPQQTSKSVIKVVKVPAITETEKFILDTVKGQDEQVRQIVNAEYKSINYKIKSNVLIVGKSGTGKTEILRQLAKKTGKVCITIDANDYTTEGYIGASVSDIIIRLLEAAEYDVERAENGIIIIDEIDKKAASKVPSQHDISGKGVQDALLKLVEGKTIPLKLIRVNGIIDSVEMNTDKIMFYFAGAFSGIDEIVKARLKKEMKMGFSAETISEKQMQLDKKIKKSDLIEFGLKEEFIGRIDKIVQLNELSEEVLENILTSSRKSKFKMYVNCLKNDGITTKYTKKNISAFAKKAKKEGQDTGARELANVINYVFDKIMYEVMSKPKGTYTKLILQEGIEEDNTKYTLK